jgi:hypothetical protein
MVTVLAQTGQGRSKHPKQSDEAQAAFKKLTDGN